MSSEIVDFLSDRISPPIHELKEPAPSDAEIEQMIRIATRVPDHGRLTPWRFILYRGDVRQEIGERLADLADKREGPLSEGRRQQEMARFSRAPLVIGVDLQPEGPSKNPAMGNVPVGRRGRHEPGARRQRVRLRRQLDHQLVLRHRRGQAHARAGAARARGRLRPYRHVCGQRSGAAAARMSRRSSPTIAARGRVERVFYEPKNGHGLPHDPFKAIVAPRPIGWISTAAGQARSISRPIPSSMPFSTSPLPGLVRLEAASRTAWRSRATAANSSSTSSAGSSRRR